MTSLGRQLMPLSSRQLKKNNSPSNLFSIIYLKDGYIRLLKHQ